MGGLKEHQFCESDECIREYRGPLSNEMRPYYLKSEADKLIAHHKYKRCLAMAMLCNKKWLVHNFAEIPTKLGFYDKWEKRWLELAEKFKPN